jgi:hypothetical protein
VIPESSPDAFRIIRSREWGASHAVLQLLKGLARIFHKQFANFEKALFL